jgi:hypothetical protein
MALEDFVEPEVGIAMAATALVASPQARNFVRRGLVYGLAGVFKLGDAISSGARGMAQSTQQAASSTGETVADLTNETQARGRRRTAPRTSPGTAPTE